MKTNANDPAITAHLEQVYQGLTKREYFAVAAMQGILANGCFQVNSEAVDQRTFHAAMTAVQAADVLIEELNKEKK